MTISPAEAWPPPPPIALLANVEMAIPLPLKQRDDPPSSLRSAANGRTGYDLPPWLTPPRPIGQNSFAPLPPVFAPAARPVILACLANPAFHLVCSGAFSLYNACASDLCSWY